MDLQTRKIEFIQKFLQISSEEAIAKFEDLLKRYNNQSESPFSKEELIYRIKQSEFDFNSGKYKTTEELLERFQ